MTFITFLQWSSIINNLYHNINKQENEEIKLKKIAKLMKKDKSYGVTSCQRADSINNYKFYIDILDGGNVLDDEYSRQIFVNNPYITKNKVIIEEAYLFAKIEDKVVSTSSIII